MRSHAVPKHFQHSLFGLRGLIGQPTGDRLIGSYGRCERGTWIAGSQPGSDFCHALAGGGGQPAGERNRQAGDECRIPEIGKPHADGGPFFALAGFQYVLKASTITGIPRSTQRLAAAHAIHKEAWWMEPAASAADEPAG